MIIYIWETSTWHAFVSSSHLFLAKTKDLSVVTWVTGQSEQKEKEQEGGGGEKVSLFNIYSTFTPTFCTLQRF